MIVKIKATFKGKDSSCGFKTNKEHTLIIQHKVDEQIKVKKIDSDDWCGYASMVLFFENWDKISVVNGIEPKDNLTHKKNK